MQSKQEDWDKELDSFESEEEESTCETKKKNCCENEIRPESVSGIELLYMIIEIKNEIKELDVKFRRHKEILEALGSDTQFISEFKTKLGLREKKKPVHKKVKWLCFW